MVKKKRVNGASQKYLNHYFNNGFNNILNQKYLNLKKFKTLFSTQKINSKKIHKRYRPTTVNSIYIILIFSQKQLAQLLNLITPSVLTHSKEVMSVLRQIIPCLRNQITNRVQAFIYFRWSAYLIKETSSHPEKNYHFYFYH